MEATIIVCTAMLCIVFILTNIWRIKLEHKLFIKRSDLLLASFKSFIDTITAQIIEPFEENKKISANDE